MMATKGPVVLGTLFINNCTEGHTLMKLVIIFGRSEKFRSGLRAAGNRKRAGAIRFFNGWSLFNQFSLKRGSFCRMFSIFSTKFSHQARFRNLFKISCFCSKPRDSCRIDGHYKYNDLIEMDFFVHLPLPCLWRRFPATVVR